MRKIGVVSQKGGVGKSTLARDIARQFASEGWKVKIADLDLKQTTSAAWNAIRMKADIKPELSVESFQSVQKAVNAVQVAGFDLLIFDGKPHSDIETRRIAQVCDIVVIPTGSTRDDLVPQTLLAHELRQAGVPAERIIFVINGVTEVDDPLTIEAAAYIRMAGYQVCEQAIPFRKSYQNAQNEGRSISEVTFPGLKEAAQNAVVTIYGMLKLEPAQ